MAVVETLDVILAAKTQQFNKDMQKEANGFRKIKKEFEQSSGSGSVFKSSFSEFAKSAPVVSGLSSNVSSLAKSITSAGSAAGPIGIAIAGSFALATAGIVGTVAATAALKSKMNEIDDIADAATRVGISFQELKTIRFSFGESIGLGGAEADGHIAKFQKSLIDASANSSDKLNAMFAKVGLNAGELLRRGPVQALNQVSEKMKALGEVDQMRLSFELFGKSGLEVVTALNEISEKSKEIDRFLSERGLKLSNSQVAAVGAANDAWDRVALTVDSLVSVVAAEFAPIFTMVANEINAGATGLSGWTSSIGSAVTGGTYLAGVFYDVYEVVTITYTTLRNIARLDFSGAIDDLKSAADFSTGQKLVDKLQKERMSAADAANDAKMKRDAAGGKASKFEGIASEEEKAKEDARKAESDRKEKDRELKRQQEKRKELEDSFKLEREIIAKTAGLSQTQAKIVEDELKKQFDMKTKIAEAGFTGPKADMLLKQGMADFKEKERLERERTAKEKEAENTKQARIKVDKSFALREELSEIQKLRKAGLISQQVFEKAAMDAAKDSVPDYKGAVSAQQGSVEAYKLIVERDNQNNQQAAIKQIAQKQLDVLNKIANSGGVVKVAR